MGNLHLAGPPPNEVRYLTPDGHDRTPGGRKIRKICSLRTLFFLELPATRHDATYRPRTRMSSKKAKSQISSLVTGSLHSSRVFCP